VEVQRAFLDLAESRFRGRDRDTDWVLEAWRGVLDALESDPMGLVGLCDWVTKKWLLDRFCEAEGLSWDRPADLAWLQSQDLEYHNVERESGLYYLLETQGKTVRLVGDNEVADAMSSPPTSTRAYARGRCLEKFGDRVKAINWDRVVFSVNGSQQSVDLKDLVEPEKAGRFNALVERSETLEAFLDAIPA
jgi:proteasome accessory factor A